MGTLRRSTQADSISGVDGFVGFFADVRRGEGTNAALLFIHVALVLAACYCVKPARDALLAAAAVDSLSGTELKAWGTGIQAVVFVLLVPAYAAAARCLRRHRMLTALYGFFAAHLLLFWALQSSYTDSVYFGLAFYVWSGAFAVVVVSQFWSFAADLYSNDAGKRLFPFIALGASLGAIAASWAVERLLSSGCWSTSTLLPAAAALLLTAALLTRSVDLRSLERAVQPENEAAVGTPFGMVLGCRYLVATMALIVVLNWVSTNGENLLFGLVQDSIRGDLGEVHADTAAVRELIADRTSVFYSGFFFWTNMLALLLQVAVASRLHRAGGCAFGLMLLPMIAFASYSLMALIPALGMIKLVKVAERATAYSVQNTAGQLLWLPTSARMKYEAKLLIDTIGVRLGDALAALTLLLGVSWLGLSLRSLFVVNLVLVAIWLRLGAMVGREHGHMVAVEVGRK